MNATARKVLQDDLDRYVQWREEKQEQIDKLERDLANAKQHLQGYDYRITELQEALEND